MKTLADLKRDLKVGDSITLVEAPTMPKHRYLGVKRFVVKKQGNGVYLNEDPTAKAGSFLEFPNAKLTDYDGNEIRVYQPGNRELTEEERRVWDNRPSKREENREMLEYDLMTDTNIMYWRDREYFGKQDMKHFNTSTNRFIFHRHDMTITDKQLKGDLELRYTLEA